MPRPSKGWATTTFVAYDHVLGASTATRPDWTGPYTSETLFHEPFVLYGYLAGLTKTLELVTGILILPQRQTALVAKQAAEVDLLSGGRLRLGIGVGWNEVEYEGLNENFRDRGVRSEEQIAVLRALWAEPVITFKGRWHTIDTCRHQAAAAAPRRSRSGSAATARQRSSAWAGSAMAGSPGFRPTTRRAPRSSVCMPPPVRPAATPLPSGSNRSCRWPVWRRDGWESYVRGWQALGATHLCVNTMGAGYRSLDEHVAALRRVKEMVAP